jgi:hypothetical protein
MPWLLPLASQTSKYLPTAIPQVQNQVSQKSNMRMFYINWKTSVTNLITVASKVKIKISKVLTLGI